VIPGTADPRHMTENLSAMRGKLPDPEQRKRMEAFAATL
jgi:diketogulonate reductase-like aldo/keto reductase